MSSETNIEQEREYKILKRVEGGVHLLVWLAVYGAAVVVVLLDVLWWRAG